MWLTVLLNKQEGNPNFKAMINDLIGLSKPIICNTYEELRLKELKDEEKVKTRFNLTIKELETTYTNYMIKKFPLKDVNKYNEKYNEINKPIVEAINKRVPWSDYKTLVDDKGIIINKAGGDENFTRCTELS